MCSVSQRRYLLLSALCDAAITRIRVLLDCTCTATVPSYQNNLNTLHRRSRDVERGGQVGGRTWRSSKSWRKRRLHRTSASNHGAMSSVVRATCRQASDQLGRYERRCTLAACWTVTYRSRPVREDEASARTCWRTRRRPFSTRTWRTRTDHHRSTQIRYARVQ